MVHENTAEIPGRITRGIQNSGRMPGKKLVEELLANFLSGGSWNIYESKSIEEFLMTCTRESIRELLENCVR